MIETVTALELLRERVRAWKKAGLRVGFVPTVEEMYPDGPPRTTVHVDRLTEGMCGASRPEHFDGVTTVVTKLFSIVGPCNAFFGRKDYQQLAVIRQMAADLNLPVDVRGCPLVREPDGVAMSSRNAYLAEDERSAARVLVQALEGAAIAVQDGERDPRALTTRVRAIVGDQPLVALEYAEVRDARTLEPVASVDGEVVLALAARVGRARLIDNLVLTVRGDEVEADLGVRATGPDL
jgi:pantoate--beta-alanine ligase